MMRKALLKKQLLELGQAFFQNRKTGKRRSAAGIAGYAVLFLFLFVLMAFSFGAMASLFAFTFVPLGLGWLLFSMMGLISIFLSSFIAMFMASSELYLAKDNDLLLSMPIPPSAILFARAVGIYLWGLLYECIIFLPTIVLYWMALERVTAAQVIMPLLVLLINSVLVLALSCVFGGIVAAITSRLRNKSLTTVLITLLLLAVYYVVYFRLTDILTSAVERADEIAAFVAGKLPPVYTMGMAAAGDLRSLLLWAAIAAVLLAAVIFVLSRSFLRIATANRGEKKTVYREKRAKQTGVGGALLGRELRRFLGCPVYLMNTGLGIVIMPIVGIVMLVRADALREMLGQLELLLPEMRSLFTAFAAAICGLFLSMDSYTAPAVSLEGKTLWLLQSMPIEPYEALRAKIRMQVLLNTLPGAFMLLCFCIAAGMTAGQMAAVLLFAVSFEAASACAGLILDLHHPNLHWTNETVPVKQSVSVLLTIFGGWGVALLFGAGAFFLRGIIAPETFTVLFSAVLILAVRLMNGWLKTKGAALFAAL